MTRYEIAARHRSGHKLLIGYTPHRSRPGLLAAVQQRSPEIIVALGTNKGDKIIIETQPPHCCRIGEWCIVFTGRDRKSTRLNSSHLGISYAVFCLKKKS